MGGARRLLIGLALVMIAAPGAASTIDAETSGHADRFTDAVAGETTDTPCNVVVVFAEAKTLRTLLDGFQFAVDLTTDVTKPMPRYKMDIGPDGRWTFGGAGLHELKADKDGVVSIPHAPKYFHVEATFGPGSTASATISRHCYGPVTRLVYVVDNPDAGVDGGDWLWDKEAP
jgi:hypothetical protein